MVSSRTAVLFAVILVTAIPSALFFSGANGFSSAAADGSASSAGLHSDFNGDGYEDLTIGSRLEDIGTLEDAGVVNVLYGSKSGLQATSPAAQLWNQDSPGVNDNAEAGESFGSSLAPGDFNGDGFSDLAIGVPNENVGSVPSAGAVNVLYGSSTGLRASPASDDSGRADQFWTPESPGMNLQVVHFFGASLSAGDFNGDGKDDLAIGIAADDKVVVLYGSGSGLQTSSPADQLWTQDSPGVEDTAEGGDFFGFQFGTNDFNDDGFDDLAVGVPEEEIGTKGFAGAANLLYGSASGLQTSSPADQFWNQNRPGVEEDAQAGDEFGWSLAGGDFNGDGFGDLAIGVPGESIGNIGRAGGVNVLYGSSSGLQTSSPVDQFWSQNSAGVPDAAEERDRFGYTMGFRSELV